MSKKESHSNLISDEIEFKAKCVKQVKVEYFRLIRYSFPRRHNYPDHSFI